MNRLPSLPFFCRRLHLTVLGLWLSVFSLASHAAEPKPLDGRFLYVAEPGIRNYLEYGGHGVLVFDLDHGHRFVKRLPSSGVDAQNVPINVKGICASAATGRLYVSNIKTLVCIDLATDKIVWEKPYEGGCDRMAISDDGKVIYLPSFEGPHWNIVNAIDGSVIAKIVPDSGAHNTIMGPDGKEVYLAGLRSPLLTVADTATQKSVCTVGPFSAPIRPFTINGKQTLVYVNVNKLLGFEIGDLKTGKVLQQVKVTGFPEGDVKRHGCPSHGIALTLDEKEIWLADGHNNRLHIFDNTVMPPKQIDSIEVSDQPGWITFSIDGKWVYPSTGEVIDAKTRKVLTTLKDETGKQVQSEKLMEIDFKAGHAIRTGNQFAIGDQR